MKGSRLNGSNSGQKKKQTTFRIGRVGGDLRGQVWYLTYFESGQRRRPRVGPDLQAAKTLAAQINGQLASGVPAALSFDAISVVALRDGWLEHHELVLQSSVQTIARYRTATEHLLRFLTDFQPVRSAAEFKVAQAETFVRYLSGELGETSPGLAAILSGPGYHGHPRCRHAVQLSDRRRRRFDFSSPTAFQ